MTASAPAAPAPPARVQLARDARTQLAVPALLIVLGAVLLVAAAALVVLALVPVAAAAVLAVPGIALVVAGVAVAVRVRSLRLAVEPDYLHLTGIRVDRRYHLAPGNLARVPAGGVERRRRPNALGRAVGSATLRTTGESIELIQLGSTPSVIVVPTEQGRVALAAAAEADLVEALMAAARTRAARPTPPPAAPPAALAAAAPTAVAPPAAPSTPTTTPPAAAIGAAVTAAAAVAPPPPAEPPPAPRPLTGIERMALEEQMASERQAAFAGARTEQAAAGLTASAAISAPGRPAPFFPPVQPAPVAAAPVPSAMPAAAAAPAATATAVAPAPPRALPRALPRRRPLRPMARRVVRPSLGPDLAILGVPLVGAAIVWAVAVFAGMRPAADGMDPIGFALLLCGPAAVLAAFLARSRWPRLAGLTSVAAVITLALVVRAVIG
jgi:hypothetical protein